MSEIKQNLKKLYKIFKTTKFPFYNKAQFEKKKGNKNIFLRRNYQPLKREFLSKEDIPSKNLYYTSRLYKYEKYNPKTKLKNGIIKINSIDKSHPDFKIIENHKIKLKSYANIYRNNDSDLYKCSTRIQGSELNEDNKTTNNLLNLFNEKDDYEYKILLQKFLQKNKKDILSPKYKNAQTNTQHYHSLTERNNFFKIPPIKNQYLKRYFY
jgi:hypothetical protein